MDTDVTYELDDRRVAWLTLDGPSKLNAIAPTTMEKLRGALARGDAEARVIVLQGAGRAFCAGADLSSVARAGATSGPALPPKHSLMETQFNATLQAIRDLVTPLVVSVNGAAAGGGLALALAGDLIIAAEDAYLLAPFQRLGLGPDMGTSYQLVRALGRVRAAEVLMLGDRIPAERALAWGLISRVVPAGALQEATRELAHRLADGPARALGFTHRMLWRAGDSSLDEALERELAYHERLSGKPESLEGRAAFAERRDPDFPSVGY